MKYVVILLAALVLVLGANLATGVPYPPAEVENPYVNSSGVSSGPINMNNNYISGVSQLRMQDTGQFCFGASCSANNTRMYSSTILDQATWGLGSEHGRQMLFVEANNVSNDYGVAVATNPLVCVFSSTAAASATDEWMCFSHNVTSGVISAGSGGVTFTGGGVVPAKVTADPCGANYPEGSIFYNDTSNYWCGCDGTNDIKLSDGAACF